MYVYACVFACCFYLLRNSNLLVEVCKNKEDEDSCIQWKAAGYCKATSIFYSYMKRSCQKACGFCKVKGKFSTLSVLLSSHQLFVINDCLSPCYQVVCYHSAHRFRSVKGFPTKEVIIKFQKCTDKEENCALKNRKCCVPIV